MSMLETQALTREFGGVIAVNKVDFFVEKNMITGLIGPNGAGKTTLFNNSTGLDTPTSGKVFFEGKEITGTSADKVCRLGIARTFQNIRLFKELSVIDNVMVGRHFHTGNSRNRTIQAILSYLNVEKEEKKTYTIKSDENLGEVKIADEVVAIIAGLAAMEVEGVSSMAGNATRELIAKLGMKSLSKGVKVDVLDGIVTVTLALNMSYGYSIKDITAKVQEKVKAAIENMTGLEVADVNIRVAGVDVPEEA